MPRVKRSGHLYKIEIRSEQILIKEEDMEEILLQYLEEKKEKEERDD